jgi:uncharacterized membrane protein
MFEFLCHQIPERSFCWFGVHLPVCTRCTGILLGFVIGLVLPFFTGLQFRNRYALGALALNATTMLHEALDHNWLRFVFGICLGATATLGWGNKIQHSLRPRSLRIRYRGHNNRTSGAS